MNDENEQFANNFLNILRAYLAVGIIALITFFVFKFYSYQPIENLEEIRQSYSVKMAFSLLDVAREAKERLIYVLSITICPLVIFLTFLAPKNLLKIDNEKSYRTLYSYLALGSSYFLALIFLCDIFRSYYDPDYYYSKIFGSWQKDELYISIFPIIFATLLSFLLVLYSKFNDEIIKKKLAVFFVIVGVILAALVFFYEYPGQKNLDLDFDDLNPVIYPIMQVFLGKAVLIDLKSLYGLYPHFLAPLLHLEESVDFVNTIIVLLFLISLLSVMFCFFSIIKNKLLALIGFAVFLYNKSFAITITFPVVTMYAPQYESIRMFFPSLLLLFMVFFLKSPSPKKYWFSLILFSCGTLWNLDVGIPTFLTLIFVLGYHKWFVGEDEKFGLKSIIIHAVQSFGTLAATWAIFFLFLRINYGEWPNIELLTYGQSAAVKYGYAMLPISFGDNWHYIVITYIVGGVVAFSNFFNQKKSPQDLFILTLTLLGVGLFAYFIGRSHGANVFHCGYPAIILLTIFADKFCNRFDGKNIVIKTPLSFPRVRPESFLLILPLLSIAYTFSLFFFNFFGNEMLKKGFVKNNYFVRPSIVRPHWIEEVNFIKKNIKDDGKVRDDLLILDLSDNKDFYFASQLRAKSPLNFVNMQHVFYVKELESLYDLIDQKKQNWVVLLEPLEKNKMYNDEEVSEMKRLLTNGYKIADSAKFGEKDNVTIYLRD